jgi:hypothetical protein
VPNKIDLHLLLKDSKEFFKEKQEGMASSPSGWCMGHYKVILDEIMDNWQKLL